MVAGRPQEAARTRLCAHSFAGKNLLEYDLAGEVSPRPNKSTRVRLASPREENHLRDLYRMIGFCGQDGAK
jgi:hypothetical protein